MQALIATLEQSLRLHRHEAGQLLRLDAYLHERTDGMIGSLSHLIRGAARSWPVTVVVSDSLNVQLTRRVSQLLGSEHRGRARAASTGRS